MRLSGEVALVTGAGQGIGAGIARRLAADGASVAVTDLDLERAQTIAGEIGPQARAMRLNVCIQEEIEAAVEETRRKLGSVSILVNNAGIQRVSPSEHLTRERWDAVVAVNLTAVFACTQAVAPHMLRDRRGAIVNLASTNSEIAMPGRAAYCATKSGVLGLTRALAVEWASRGVRVNAVEPGYVRTPMVDRAIADGLIDEDALLARIPAGRLADTAEVAAVVAFLASDDASYITGRALAIDGGFLAYGAPAPASAAPLIDYDP